MIINLNSWMSLFDGLVVSNSKAQIAVIHLSKHTSCRQLDIRTYKFGILFIRHGLVELQLAGCRTKLTHYDKSLLLIV